jgi:hypothetical protein
MAAYVDTLFGRSPGATFAEAARKAWPRALRTTLQALVAAVVGSASAAVLTTGYWVTLAVLCIGALLAGAASFLQNVAMALPEDPTQKTHR